MWLYVVTWPEAAGYVLAEGLVLADLTEGVPGSVGLRRAVAVSSRPGLESGHTRINLRVDA